MTAPDFCFLGRFLRSLFFSGAILVQAGVFAEELLPLTLGAATLQVEVVRTPADREKGLQHRTQLPENQGMLFVFPVQKKLSFWMKDTRIPLDIAFIDAEGCLLQIETMTPFSLRPVRSSKKCVFALEVRRGWFQEKGILPLTRVTIPEIVKDGVS